MDRMVEIVIGDVRYELNYSIAVMFEMQKKFGNITNALDIIECEDKEGFEAVRWFFVQMVNDAELCRRNAGYDYGPMLTLDDIPLQISPFDYQQYKVAVVMAIQGGYSREIEGDKEQDIDLGLAELESKKAEARD